MRSGAARLCGLLMLPAISSAQQFPIRHAGSIGDLEGKAAVTLGIATATSVKPGYVRLDGRDRSGMPWRVWLGAHGGIVGTDVWTADFDRNGHEDLLVARRSISNGTCVVPVDLVVLLFDSGRRPVPWKIHTQLPHERQRARYPFWPVTVVDMNRDGRAEFVPTGCASPFSESPIKGEWIDAIYDAKDARLSPMRNPDLGAYRAYLGLRNVRPVDSDDPRPLSRPWGRIQSMAAPVFGGSSDAPEKASGPELLIGGKSEPMWPDDIVIDGPSGRDVHLEDFAEGGSQGLRRVFRNGYRARLFDDGLLWADSSEPRPARVAVSLEATASYKRTYGVFREADGCSVHYTGESSRFRACESGLWTRFVDSSREELLADRITIRTSHSAMGITHSSEIGYERPPGAEFLMGLSVQGLTQWSSAKGPRFAMHHEGRLVEPDVHVPFAGQLVSGEDVLAFAKPAGRGQIELTEVHGRFRWRRIE